MESDTFDFEVERYKTAVMQRIQQAAARGYAWYTSGLVHHEKALNLCNKFARLYGVNLNENQRSYRKRKQHANSMLFIYPKKDSPYLLWWLLATDGEGEIHKNEKLISIHDNHRRLVWDDDYELVMMPKAGAKPRITWRMTRKCYQEWNDRIRKAIRQKYTDDSARQAAWSLKRTPGFGGIREQVMKLNNLFSSEWKRIRKSTEEMPSVSFVGYVRGIKSNKLSLSIVLKRMKQGKRPFPRNDDKTNEKDNRYDGTS